MNSNTQPAVAIFWDIENCPPPKGMRGTSVERKIREGLHEHGPIRQFFAYAELARFPSNLRMELQRSGVHLIDAPKGPHSKDVADHMIITDMFVFALENVAPQKIVLISGDIDYAYTLAKLRQRHFEIMLILPPVGAHPILKEQADIILEWTDLMELDRTSTEAWDKKLALRYEPLISALQELWEHGNPQPTTSEVEAHLNTRYPAWRQTSQMTSIDAYIDDAKMNGWINIEKTDSGKLIHLIVDEQEPSEDVEDEEGDRFGPLLTVLREAEKRGHASSELSYIGIQLRSLMNNPLEKLGVSQLKDYVIEAQGAGLVVVHQDGLQHYVSMADREEGVAPEDSEEAEKILDLLEAALESLKDDEMMPTVKALIGRMRELQPGWNLFKSCYEDIPNLLNVAKKKRGIVVEAQPPSYLIFPKTGRFSYVDMTDSEFDPFTKKQWSALKNFLKTHSDIIAKGRYGFTKRLKEENIPGVSDIKLGLLAHLVQLAINRDWLVFQWNKLSVSPAFVGR